MRFFGRLKPRKEKLVISFRRAITDPTAPGGWREVCEGEEWEKRREEVWVRDGRACRVCHEPLPLHNLKAVLTHWTTKAAECHHLRKRKSGGQDRDDRHFNLLTVCWICHPKVEDGRSPLALVEGVVRFQWNGVWRYAATRADVQAALAAETGN